MALLIPAVNASTEEVFVQRGRLVRTFSPWVQVDVSDGIFGVPKNAATPSLAARELSGLRLDAHLMVADAERAVTDWLQLRPTRITVHVETLADPQSVLARLRGAGIERGLALGPATPVERVTAFLPDIDLLLFVAVPPGRSGQAFDPQTVNRVRAVRAVSPTVRIGVDGGVNAARIPDLRAAGVDVIVAASAIFEDPDPRGAYQRLKHLAES